MTFSNPRYDVMQTAPYQTDNNGIPINAACVGAVSPVEEGATLEPADDLSTPPVVPPGPAPINIGTVTVNTNNPIPAVGDTVTYTALHSGSAADIVDTFSAPGETFTGGTVTWANDGATTVTCESTSVTAVDSPRQGSLPVTVAPAGGGTPPGTITIGTVTVTGNASPTVGGTVTYTATRSGNSADTVFTFSAPGETFTGGTVTWANDGATTVGVSATSATATDSPAIGTLAVTVAPAGGGGAPVNFTSFTSSSITDGQALGANSTFHFNGSPNGCTGNNTSPQLSWAVDDDTDVDTYLVRCTDITNPWLHWEFEVPSTTTSVIENVAAGDLAVIVPNDWAQSGISGSNANGWGGPCPPGSTHTYRLRVFAFAADGSNLGDSDPIDFTAS